MWGTRETEVEDRERRNDTDVYGPSTGVEPEMYMRKE